MSLPPISIFISREFYIIKNGVGGNLGVVVGGENRDRKYNSHLRPHFVNDKKSLSFSFCKDCSPID